VVTAYRNLSGSFVDGDQPEQEREKEKNLTAGTKFPAMIADEVDQREEGLVGFGRRDLSRTGILDGADRLRAVPQGRVSRERNYQRGLGASAKNTRRLSLRLPVHANLRGRARTGENVLTRLQSVLRGKSFDGVKGGVGGGRSACWQSSRGKGKQVRREKAHPVTRQIVIGAGLLHEKS